MTSDSTAAYAAIVKLRLGLPAIRSAAEVDYVPRSVPSGPGIGGTLGHLSIAAHGKRIHRAIATSTHSHQTTKETDMPILYKDGGACYFKDTSDARFALQHGWSDDPAGYIPPTLSPAELQSASDLAEMWRLGHNISAAERTLVANYMLSQADANENWGVMPSESQNRWC